jgi:hypothetical protein
MMFPSSLAIIFSDFGCFFWRIFFACAWGKPVPTTSSIFTSIPIPEEADESDPDPDPDPDPDGKESEEEEEEEEESKEEPDDGTPTRLNEEGEEKRGTSKPPAPPQSPSLSLPASIAGP